MRLLVATPRIVAPVGKIDPPPSRYREYDLPGLRGMAEGPIE
jgi:hypothetical protein